MTYLHAKFECASSNSLGDAFTRKTILLLTLAIGSGSNELSSKLNIMKPMHLQRLKLVLPIVLKEMRLLKK